MTKNTFSNLISSSISDENQSLKAAEINNSHEQIKLIEGNKHEQELLDKKNAHEIALRDKELGWLGKIFGGRELTASNISGALIILLLIIGVTLTCFLIFCSKPEDDISIEGIWSILTPIITLTLGYVFGSKPEKTSSK
ncbi:hypothetical protein EYV94_15290 [Puteibacter caeruleilacunae]|nr:hypothetical protein EYV94_15290 [Puteibacter caeruleilacunae]